MFAAYPGFEELPLRVEVEWRGRKQTVVARLEQWPNSDIAVLVCQFIGEDNEFLIQDWLGFYCRRNPQRALRRNISYQTEPPRLVWDWKRRAKNQMRAVIESAFHRHSHGYPMGLRPTRALYLADLPEPPQIVVETRTAFYLCSSPGQLQNVFVPFRLNDRLTSLDKKTRAATAQLMQLWRDENSGLRFAWEWTHLSEAQKQRKVTGFDGDLSELERVMRWVLTGSTSPWLHSSAWYWNIHVNPANDLVYAYDGNYEAAREKLAAWNWFLRAHFLPNSRKFTMGACAQSHIVTVGEVRIEQAPTAHEQLEAKLALRDWLADKATPLQIEELLA